jgi:hypothetical protein
MRECQRKAEALGLAPAARGSACLAYATQYAPVRVGHPCDL